MLIIALTVVLFKLQNSFFSTFLAGVIMESINGHALYERIVSRCNELNYTPTYVCEQIGTRKSVISDLKNGRINTIQASLLWEFARFLRVSCDWLISGVDYNAPVFSHEETELVRCWRACSAEERENIAFSLRAYGMPMPKPTQQESAV